MFRNIQIHFTKPCQTRTHELLLVTLDTITSCSTFQNIRILQIQSILLIASGLGSCIILLSFFLISLFLACFICCILWLLLLLWLITITTWHVLWTLTTTIILIIIRMKRLNIFYLIWWALLLRETTFEFDFPYNSNKIGFFHKENQASLVQFSYKFFSIEWINFIII